MASKARVPLFLLRVRAGPRATGNNGIPNKHYHLSVNGALPLPLLNDLIRELLGRTRGRTTSRDTSDGNRRMLHQIHSSHSGPNTAIQDKTHTAGRRQRATNNHESRSTNKRRTGQVNHNGKGNALNSGQRARSMIRRTYLTVNLNPTILGRHHKRHSSRQQCRATHRSNDRGRVTLRHLLNGNHNTGSVYNLISKAARINHLRTNTSGTRGGSAHTQGAIRHTTGNNISGTRGQIGNRRGRAHGRGTRRKMSRRKLSAIRQLK